MVGVMKKNSVILILLGLLSAAFGIALKVVLSSPFVGFSGLFDCGDQGIPNKNYNILRFNPEETVDAMFGSKIVNLGKFKIEGARVAKLELGMEMIHSPDFSLDPFAQYVILGQESAVELVGRSKEGKEVARFRCVKK
jgi:hypothetical protein